MGLDDEVETLYIYKENKIIAGGKFSSGSNSKLFHIAVWENEKWTRLPVSISPDPVDPCVERNSCQLDSSTTTVKGIQRLLHNELNC